MSSTVSSTRSRGSSGSSTSTSATDSISASTTPSPIVSQTFTPPSVSSTSTTPVGGGGGGGGGNNAGWNGPSIASSASLYLYTFLATLVLLLSVSAAIILRSLILRRRHRRMVEEAIRNGIWIPPSPGTTLASDGTGSAGFGGRMHAHPFGPGRARAVDLSKKPKMWETFVSPVGVEVGAATEKGRRTSVRDEEKRAEAPWDPLTAERAEDRETEGECEWDNLKPIAVAYLVPPPSGTTTHASALPSGPTQQQQQLQPLLSSRTQEQAEEEQQQQQQRRRRRALGTGTRTVLRRILHLLSPTPATPSSPLPHPLTPASTTAAALSFPTPSAAAGEASEQHRTSPVIGSALPGTRVGARQDDAAAPPHAAAPVPVVQVAVLIAMPSAAKPHYFRPSLTSSDAVSSPSSSTYAHSPPMEAEGSTSAAAPGPSTPTSSDFVPPDSPETRAARGSVRSRHPPIPSTGPQQAGTGAGDEGADGDDDEGDAEPRLLPHIEFGIAKVEMKLDDVASADGSEGAPTATGPLQGKMMRISVASSMDVV